MDWKGSALPPYSLTAHSLLELLLPESLWTEGRYYGRCLRTSGSGCRVSAGKYKQELETHCHTSEFIEIHWSCIAHWSPVLRSLCFEPESHNLSLSYFFAPLHLFQVFWISLLCPQCPQFLSLYIAEIQFCLCHDLSLIYAQREVLFYLPQNIKVSVLIEKKNGPRKGVMSFFYEAISLVALIFFLL